MSEPELPGYRAFLRYWSFDSLDVKEAEHNDSAEDDESQNQSSGPSQNFAGARSYLRFLREPDASEHLTDGSDGSNCTGDADAVGELCDACLSRANDIDRIKYFYVLPESPLLLPAPSEDETDGSCPNLHHNDPDLWAEEPNFYRALAADGMGIESRFILRDRLEQDLQWLEKANVCKFRVWNFLDVGDRDDADLLAVVSVLKHHQYELGIEEDTHMRCTPGFCQKGNVDSTKVVQVHKCEDHNSCDPLEFDLELVNDAVVKGHSTAWICDQAYEQPGLITDGNDYVAISHVWADGTGVGDYQRDNKSASMVNRCLWEFWQNMVGQVWQDSYKGAPAIWWDTVSIPRDTKKRSMALRSLHRNYSGAKCTIVHDMLLAQITTPSNAVRCVALVLSNWFSRGWTALELQMSNEVWVVFDNTPIPLNDILAESPATAHPVHWLATTMIKRLQAPIDDVGDILHILKARSTSWARDKTIIAALLADSGVKKEEPALLVKMIGEMGSEDDDTPSMSCQYVGAVWETEMPENNWQTCKVLIGPENESGTDDNQWEVHLPVHDAKAPTWLEEAAPVDDWLEQGESFIAQLSKVLLGSDGDSSVNPVLESILQGNTQSVQYQLESTLSKDEFDFGMIEDLKSTGDELDVTDGQLSDIINGLWLLGDYALKFRDFENTNSAYFAAHELATKYLKHRESQNEDIPAHTDAMLWYQRGLALLLKADYEPAIECLQQAVPGKVSKVTNQVISQSKTRNGRRYTQYRRVSSYMVARDWGAETEAWYRVRRSALGALILLSADPNYRAQHANLDPPEKYFLDSIRHEDRVLFSGDEKGNISELGFGIIRYCLREKGTDENELPQYSLEEIQLIANALKSVLEKFDTLFQKEHILCCISSLCLGVTSQMTMASVDENSELGRVQKREYEALASAQFKRVDEDLMKVLPYVEGMGPQDWALGKVTVLALGYDAMMCWKCV
ncbi:hypothetical protein CEP54_014485 [Fusarium duplospermum]|uniref:Heterokaryon incompatibility domain-containing protein n=1 Tax=Fusarium duplospermum TaxID=1325734 RepID=A0A428NVS1_9HYPO|nr:hypothetical protein CEP54_014485 [Fusarium duplospermum]